MRRIVWSVLILFVLMGFVFSEGAGAQSVLFSGWIGLSPGSSLDAMEEFVESLGYAVTRSDSLPATLAGYDILVLMGGGSDDENIPDAVVDDFVNAGNGLLILEGIVEAGDFNLTAESNPVESCSGWDWRTNATVVDLDHPVCTGVSPACAFAGYSTSPVFKPGAHVLLQWDDQTPFAATYSLGSGLIVYFNHLQAWYYAFWGDDPANGGKLLENALAWVSPVSAGEETPPGLPEPSYVLYQCYPNPFGESTSLSYFLSNETRVCLQILDLQGRTVRVLENATISSAGHHTTRWDGRDARGRVVPSGAYVCWLKTDGAVRLGRIISTR
ncbi:T9SS type A sorting domain-containing protein [Candidatus Fermentibacteria bacterium]|nr:T9SS type A sorting domain-containing protein [Candidatus Fermentibacteria bacterium]